MDSWNQTRLIRLSFIDESSGKVSPVGSTMSLSSKFHLHGMGEAENVVTDCENESHTNNFEQCNA